MRVAAAKDERRRQRYAGDRPAAGESAYAHRGGSGDDERERLSASGRPGRSNRAGRAQQPFLHHPSHKRATNERDQPVRVTIRAGAASTNV